MRSVGVGMSEFFDKVFSSAGFMPHGHCYLWNPALVWLHVISDGLTAAAYTTIPFTLFYFARKRRDVPFNWVLLCFAMFIIACGATHVLEIWTLWVPSYWLSGSVKALTAAASVPTAVLLVRLLPTAIALPTSGQLQKALAELEQVKAGLEERVRERTDELVKKNEQLAAEVAERKKVEARLLTSELRLRRLADSGLIGLLTADDEGHILDANDSFLKLVGYSREELTSGALTRQKLTPPEWHDDDVKAVAQLRATGAMLREKEYMRRDGTRVPVLAGAAVVEAGHELISFVVDLTERKRAEAAIAKLTAERQADARFRELLETAPDAMVIVDEAGTIVLVNAQTERLFGYTREELVGHSVDALVPDRVRPQHPLHRASYYSSPQSRQLLAGLELSARKKDGSEFPVEVSLSPLTTSNGVLVSSAIRDVTKRRETEAALRSSNRELEAFSYSVAHDLRTPLRGINGFAQVLYDDYRDRLDAAGAQYLEKIRENTKRMGLLIDALLSLARVSRAEVRHERVDLSAMARAVATQCAALEPDRAVDFVIRDGLFARGDATLLRTLLDNLINNAFKFTHGVASPRIEFGASPVNGAPVFWLRDNGAGFDMAHVDKLFVAFQRLHGPREFPGTGIGLATCQRIVTRHGGRIWAEGAISAGATFYFSLPDQVSPGAAP